MCAGRSRNMIGVFTAQLDDAYQAAVWRGIESRARQCGVGVICFLGHRLDPPFPSEAAANLAYRIANRRNIDGLIIVTTTIATFVDGERVNRLFASRADLPQVSVGLEVSGIPSITADGSEGVIEVVRHLVREHGSRRFAVIGGPSGHPEAEQRARAFRSALSSEGVAFDEDLAVPGTFLYQSGKEAARHLLESGKSFDAVVCMNDKMALGALEVFREARIEVPGDVALVGFDGIEEAKFVTPPLTTVVQPLHELGQSAVDVLLDVMKGRRPENRVLSCAPVFRQSCGCPPRRGFYSDLDEVPAFATPEERSAIAELEELVVRSDEDGFIARLNGALTSASLNGGNIAQWNEFLSVIRNKALPRGADSRLIELGRVIVGDTESRLQAARRVAAEERLSMLRIIGSSLSGAFETPVMLGRLKTGLPRLGINGGFLVLFDGSNPLSGRGRLVMALRDGESEEIPPGGISFSTSRLLPPLVGASWKRGHWVLEILVFETEPLGYLILTGGATEPAVYDSLGEQLASALKGTLLLDQVHSHERRLEAEVIRRTAELTRTNDELTREIERRMRLEQEVLEISNQTMQRIGQDLHDDLCQHLAGIAMLASVLRGNVSNGDPAAIEAIDNISGLLADSIFRTKQIARGLYPAGLEEQGLAAAVEELVASVLRKYPVSIDFRASPDFLLRDTNRALQVYRIVQEALANALKHSGSDRIDVRLYREEPRRRGESDHAAGLIVEVTDYGSGLPKTIRGRGMGLKIMRYRAETSGVELRIERLNPGTRIFCRIPSERREDI